MKRFASNYLYVPQLGLFNTCVLEIENDGTIFNIYPLDQEREAVIWLPGLLLLIPRTGCIKSMNEFLADCSFHKNHLASRMALTDYNLNVIKKSTYSLIRVYPFDFKSMLPPENTNYEILI